jgi:lysophospholipase L1-like esterase
MSIARRIMPCLAPPATLALVAITAFPPAAHARDPGIGVVGDPCASVPLEPTPEHRASADWYGAWRAAWLALDWGQSCRYRGANAALPPASSRRVVFIGDSITEGWMDACPALFRGDRLDRGIGGQTTAQMLVRFRTDVLDLKPSVVHLMAGTNDIAGNGGPTTLAAIEGHIQSMIELARAHHIRMILGAVPPAAHFDWAPDLRPAATIRALNLRLAALALRLGADFVDYHAALDDGNGGLSPRHSGDGVHPNEEGYALMRPLAESAIDRALRRPAP